jgi:predicted  nucleic acid-binding Zn-ribbon protein
MARRYTEEEYKEKLKQVHGEKYTLLGSFKNTETKTLMRCNVCLHEWSVRPGSLTKGKGCPECGKVTTKNVKKWHVSQSDFLAKIPSELLDRIEVLGSYVSVHDYLEVKCKICGLIWDSKPAYLFRGYGCGKCGRDRKGLASRKKHVDFQKEIENKYKGAIQLLGEYVKGNQEIEAKCIPCGKIFSKAARRLLKRGCPNCLYSKGEFYISQLLTQMSIKHSSQYWFKDLRGDFKPLRFDFAVFNDDGSLKCLLEYDGPQHFNNISSKRRKSEFDFNKLKRYDKKKEDYCFQNDIDLIRIPFYDYPYINVDYLRSRLCG